MFGRSVSQYRHSEEESRFYCAKKVYCQAAEGERCNILVKRLLCYAGCFSVSEEFDNYMQQDAHEFLNFLINHISEIILGKYLIQYRINIGRHS